MSSFTKICVLGNGEPERSFLEGVFEMTLNTGDPYPSPRFYKYPCTCGQGLSETDALPCDSSAALKLIHQRCGLGQTLIMQQGI